MPASLVPGRFLSRRTSSVLVVLVATLILVLSLIPRPEPILGALSLSDKVAHLLAYVVLGLVARCAIGRRGLVAAAVTIAACSLFGGIIEIVQPLVGRRAEWSDFAIDAAGAALGASAASLLLRMLAGKEIKGPAGSRQRLPPR